MTTLALTFNGVTLSPISHKNQTWLTSVELSKALGYADEKSVSRIFTRNKDEFSNKMTTLFQGGQFDHPRQNDVTTESSGLKAGTRIFSLRGCHLIAMFAKTVIAKQFRVWVLDILDKEVGQVPYGLKETATISKAQIGEIACRVDEIVLACKDAEKVKPAIWSRFRNHFRINGYKELPVDKFDDALAYLEKLREEYASGKVMVLIDAGELEQLRNPSRDTRITRYLRDLTPSVSLPVELFEELKAAYFLVQAEKELKSSNNLDGADVAFLRLTRDMLTNMNLVTTA